MKLLRFFRHHTSSVTALPAVFKLMNPQQRPTSDRAAWDKEGQDLKQQCLHFGTFAITPAFVDKHKQTTDPEFGRLEKAQYELLVLTVEKENAEKMANDHLLAETAIAIRDVVHAADLLIDGKISYFEFICAYEKSGVSAYFEHVQLLSQFLDAVVKHVLQTPTELIRFGNQYTAEAVKLEHRRQDLNSRVSHFYAYDRQAVKESHKTSLHNEANALIGAMVRLLEHPNDSGCLAQYNRAVQSYMTKSLYSKKTQHAEEKVNEYLKEMGAYLKESKALSMKMNPGSNTNSGYDRMDFFNNNADSDDEGDDNNNNTPRNKKDFF